MDTGARIQGTWYGSPGLGEVDCRNHVLLDQGCEPAEFGLGWHDDRNGTVTYFVHELVDAADYSGEDPDVQSCIDVAQSATVSHWQGADVRVLGAQVDDENFQPLEVVDLDAQRIAGVAYRSANGSITLSQGTIVGLNDTERRERCSLRMASDGLTRCLPVAGGSLIQQFADSECSLPLASELQMSRYNAAAESGESQFYLYVEDAEGAVHLYDLNSGSGGELYSDLSNTALSAAERSRAAQLSVPFELSTECLLSVRAASY